MLCGIICCNFLSQKKNNTVWHNKAQQAVVSQQMSLCFLQSPDDKPSTNCWDRAIWGKTCRDSLLSVLNTSEQWSQRSNCCCSSICERIRRSFRKQLALTMVLKAVRAFSKTNFFYLPVVVMLDPICVENIQCSCQPLWLLTSLQTQQLRPSNI